MITTERQAGSGRRGRSPAGQQGLVLAATAWLGVLIAVLAMTLSTSLRTEISITHNRLENSRARALVEAGVQRGILELFRPQRDERWAADGTRRWIELDGTRVAIEIRDEGGKIDLNHAPEALLHGLLSAVGVDDPRRRLHLVDAIRDWSDADDLPRPFGVEQAEYRQAGRPDGPANTGFTRPSELRRVLGIDRELYQELRPYITVYSQRARINPWTAPATVLHAVPGVDAQAVRHYVEERHGARERGQGPSSPPRGRNHYLVSEARAFEVTAVVRLASGASARASAVVALGRGTGELPFRLLEWKS